MFIAINIIVISILLSIVGLFIENSSKKWIRIMGKVLMAPLIIVLIGLGIGFIFSHFN